MRKHLMLWLVLVAFILPVVSADLITPTVTNVYFEKNGQPYNSSVTFTVKGYGYNIGIPGSPGYAGEKLPGTYTPEVVFSFSATSNNYGDAIHENYYMNYIHIDYFEVEGKISNSQSFKIKNLKDFLSNCSAVNPEDDPQYKSCMGNLVKPNVTRASQQPVGTIREDYLGRNWTKGHEWWTSPSEPGLSWGDMMWAETDKAIYQYNEEKKKCDDILDEKMLSEDYPERECEIRLDLGNAEWNSNNQNQIAPSPSPSPEPIRRGFWGSISCFFRGLFGRSC
jgi:hypothetical protein